MAQAPAPPYIPAAAHGGADNKPIDLIVMHGTVSACVKGGARNIANFFRGGSSGTSAHYVVDPGEVIQCVYDSYVAWHCGHNTNSLGVELCDPVDGPASRWKDNNHQDMLRVAARLVAGLCDAYGIPKKKLTVAQVRAGQRGICGHVDIRDAFPGATTHYDPGPAFPWDQFIGLVSGGHAAAEEDELPSAKDVVTEWDKAHPKLNQEDLADYILNGYKAKDWAGNAQSVNGRLNNMDHRIYEIHQMLTKLTAK